MSKDQLADVRNKKIGFVFQGFNLLSRTNALDNVELPLLYGGGKLRGSERQQKAMESARDGRARRRARSTTPTNCPADSSSAWPSPARSSTNPSILLADEPTGNLDTRTSIEIMGIFQRLNRDRGITVLVITHERDIAEYSDRIITFREASMVSDQPIRERRWRSGSFRRFRPKSPPPANRGLHEAAAQVLTRDTCSRLDGIR